MLKYNNITLKQRLKELFIDYICILIYLIILLVIALFFYLVLLKDIPEFNELLSQLIASMTSVIPIVLIFSFLDYTKGSFGKRKAGLELYFKHKKIGVSFIRNIIKFLPWQLAHIGVIHGMYTRFDLVSFIFTISSMILAILMIVMGIVRNDKRHLGDIIAGTQTRSRTINS